MGDNVRFLCKRLSNAPVLLRAVVMKLITYGKAFTLRQSCRLVPDGLWPLIRLSHYLDACSVRFQQLRRLIG
jgi:hypothetical protein